MTLSRDAAWQLLTEWTQSESLRKHALAVEAAVRGYARQQGANEEEWGVVALLHDFDYERYPTLGDHPEQGLRAPAIARLSGMGDARHSVARLGDHRRPARDAGRKDTGRVRRAGRLRDRRVARAAQSRACSTSRPTSVIKRMKDKAFARQVPRDHLMRGAELMGLPLDEHVTNVIGFMRLQADALGLRGTL